MHFNSFFDDLQNEKFSLIKNYDAISISKENLSTLSSSKEFDDLKKLADSGLVDAQFQVGYCYEDGKGVPKSYKSAFYYYKLAADQGHYLSQVCLALLFDGGLGTKQDYQQAFYYYKLAAEQKGCPAILGRIGELYAEGKGVEKSAEEAARYYQGSTLKLL